MTKSGVPASPLVYQPEMMTGEKRHVPFRSAPPAPRRGTGEYGTVAGTASGNLQPQTMHILLAENRAGWAGLAP